jgi:peptidoglycan hydrolase CwlO-like protein
MSQDHHPETEDVLISRTIDYKVDASVQQSPTKMSPWQWLLYGLLALIMSICLVMIVLQSQKIDALSKGVTAQQAKIEKLQAVAEKLQTINGSLKEEIRGVTEELQHDLQSIGDRLQTELKAVDDRLESIQ